MHLAQAGQTGRPQNLLAADHLIADGGPDSAHIIFSCTVTPWLIETREPRFDSHACDNVSVAIVYNPVS